MNYIDVRHRPPQRLGWIGAAIAAGTSIVSMISGLAKRKKSLQAQKAATKNAQQAAALQAEIDQITEEITALEKEAGIKRTESVIYKGSLIGGVVIVAFIGGVMLFRRKRKRR